MIFLIWRQNLAPNIYLENLRQKASLIYRNRIIQTSPDYVWWSHKILTSKQKYRYYLSTPYGWVKFQIICWNIRNFSNSKKKKKMNWKFCELFSQCWKVIHNLCVIYDFSFYFIPLINYTNIQHISINDSTSISHKNNKWYKAFNLSLFFF